MLDGVICVGDYAFSDMDGMSSLVVPPSVKCIGEMAFSCSECLTSIVFSAGVTCVGPEAFARCENLKSLVLPGSVSAIGGFAFSGCDSLEHVYCQDGPNMSVDYQEIPASATVHYDISHPEWAEMLESAGFAPEKIVPYIPTSSGAVEVPQAWMALYPSFDVKFGANYAKALAAKNGKKDAYGNDLHVWQDYVVGTDPTDETDAFKASVAFVDGKPVVTWSPELCEEEAAKRRYVTYGKERLDDECWTDVSDVDGEARSAYKFFKVTVEMK